MKRLPAFLVTMLAAAATATAASGAAQAATPSCVVNYVVAGQWSGAFQAQVTVGYTGFPAGNGWTFAFDFVAAGQRVVNVWNGAWSQTGGHVTASSGPYPTVVPGDGSITVGFLGSYAAVNPPLVNFAFDGVRCSEAE